MPGNSHLGGHANITHIDAGAIKYLQAKFSIKSMVDVGCGPGGMAEVANNLGILWVGIDGDTCPKSVPGIIIHDFTLGELKLNQKFDLGWSVEFVEHVESIFIEHFMALFENCKYVCMTHATKGKRGHHHVNCQESSYWVEIFAAHKFELNIGVSEEIRKKSTMRREFMRNTGMFFINRNQ